jgi:ATP-dependent phosphofructokinase / diphosphate-dependent phosphofructokinase
MGRHAGWIALHAGLAAGAHLTLVPEEPFDVAEAAKTVEHRFARGDCHVIGVVAEGALPLPGTMLARDGGVDEYGHEPSPAWLSSSARSWRPAPARRCAPPCSVTCSAAGPRPPSTGCWPPASACTPRSPRTTGRWARWWPARTEIGLVPLADAVARLETVAPHRLAETLASTG